MERLTRRSNVGEYLPINHLNIRHEDTTSEDTLTEILDRLGAYEDLEVAPEQIREIDKLYTEKCGELAELKEDISQLNNDCAGLSQENKLFKAEIENLNELIKAEENGLLLRMPCKVGDTVYRVSLNDIKEYKVFAINIGVRESTSSCAILTKNNRGAVIGFETIDIGKTVFLTHEEAESKLSEMESGNERD